jgi:hypothetical protein
VFTRNFAVSWTNNVSERAAKAAKPSAAPSPEVPGYRHSPQSPNTTSRHPVNGHQNGLLDPAVQDGHLIQN